MTGNGRPPVALVAGGSRGLGLLIAGELLDRGHQVAICARDAEEIDRALELLAPRGRVVGHPCDVRDAAAVARLVADVEAELGRLDVLVTVAGIIQVAPAEAVTLAHFRDAVDTMLWGPVHLVWAVLPGMRARGRGAIGTVTSVGGLVSPPHLLPYATAKFGAVGFSEGLAAAVAGTGVTATTIAPGLMRTGSHERALFAGDVADEFAWFGPAASLPLVSMDARRAARIMVDGVLAGRPIVLVGWLPKVALRVHGLVPGLTTRVMGLVNQLLPGARPDQDETVEGRVARERLRSPVVEALTLLGRRAARRTNERTPADGQRRR